MGRLSIGLVYDLLGTLRVGPGDPSDADAEYEPVSTIDALVAAIEWLGHQAVRLGNAHELLATAGKGALPPLDAALSIAEGFGTRNREAWAPVLLDMLGIPAFGSDPLSLSLSLDKAWTLDVVAAAGVPVAAHRVVRRAEDALTMALPAPFPLFVKPRWEGTAKGIGPGSRVGDRAALAREVARILRDYRQPVLVEAFLPGAEYTVTLVGNDPPQVLPVLQRALETTTGIGLHALERHHPVSANPLSTSPVSASPVSAEWSHETPGRLDAALESELGALALSAFAALECRDFARADFRLDADGQPRFLEMNPLPTFAPDGSFGVLAELAGRAHEELLADVIAAGLRRLGLA